MPASQITSKKTTRRLALAGRIVPIAAIGAYFGWREFSRSPYPEWIAFSNGRLEAEQVDVTSKLPARITEILVEEGQMVDKGAVLVRLDAAELEAQLRAGEAQVRRAERAIDEAQHAIVLRESLRTLAQQEFDRTNALVPRQAASIETLDQRRAALDAAEAAVRQSNSSLDQAKAALDVAQAEVARLQSLLADTVLTAPRRGRVQYKLMQAGEVVAGGTRVLTLLDLADVYMTVFLPASAAAQLAPPRFEQDILAGRRASVQIDIDATAPAQAGNGAIYLQQMIAQETQGFATRGARSPLRPRRSTSSCGPNTTRT